MARKEVLMRTNFKPALMALVSSFGVAGLTTTMAVASDGISNRLFRSLSNDWIITKSDLENEENTFAKSTTYGNLIEFEKSDNLVKNVTPITGLESVTLQSTNSYLQVSTGFNEDSFLYGRYFKNHVSY